ncbi:mRNA cap guanine-N7 methyltransferase [Coemansia javaensis]|uniref:mRNA cap guanine-N(7) methyltransferase n=1 Tax=Coemansia javaensis TaxID=2761396 RepID=A0A9W8H3E1_9FUNG|nr:mRNA cap guanine-N7 methyltransferase [Coemansia javaensis]
MMMKRLASNAEDVAHHYNTRRELGTVGRLHTPITGLRLFNNWIKSLLIRKYASQGCRVLDLGCGKGGDLRKWNLSRIAEYVGMDIASVSVSQAQARYRELYNPTFTARFFAQDCYGASLLFCEPLEKTLQPPDYMADVISAQFCLHYAFETEDKARQMMRNISGHLVDDGRFICTIPNANCKKRRAAGREFGNALYQVKFFGDEITRFGTAYSFTLDEAVEDCTEYLVHMPTFVQLAAEHGLELEDCCGLHHMYAEHRRYHDSVELLRSMRVVDNDRPAISPDEWEAIGIYLAVVFRKVKR